MLVTGAANFFSYARFIAMLTIKASYNVYRLLPGMSSKADAIFGQLLRCAEKLTMLNFVLLKFDSIITKSKPIS